MRFALFQERSRQAKVRSVSGMPTELTQYADMTLEEINAGPAGGAAPQTAKAAPAKGPRRQELEQLARDLNPIVPFYDPIGLADGNFWEEGGEATVGFLRHGVCGGVCAQGVSLARRVVACGRASCHDGGYGRGGGTGAKIVPSRRPPTHTRTFAHSHTTPS